MAETEHNCCQQGQLWDQTYWVKQKYMSVHIACVYEEIWGHQNTDFGSLCLGQGMRPNNCGAE